MNADRTLPADGTRSEEGAWTLRASRIEKAIHASISNGRRLLEDAEFLEFGDPPTTAIYLAAIAREEFAKGFLLALVLRRLIPWDRRLIRASRDHTCKQLLGVVMDFLTPDLDEFLNRRPTSDGLPPTVADALNILRHEKIGRWVANGWLWAEDPVYDREAQLIADGKLDQKKQDALYVRLAADGGVACTPGGVSHEDIVRELDRGRQLSRLVERLVAGDPHPGPDFDRVEGAVQMLFASVGS